MSRERHTTCMIQVDSKVLSHNIFEKNKLFSKRSFTQSNETCKRRVSWKKLKTREISRSNERSNSSTAQLELWGVLSEKFLTENIKTSFIWRAVRLVNLKIWTSWSQVYRLYFNLTANLPGWTRKYTPEVGSNRKLVRHSSRTGIPATYTLNLVVRTSRWELLTENFLQLEVTFFFPLKKFNLTFNQFFFPSKLFFKNEATPSQTNRQLFTFLSLRNFYCPTLEEWPIN